MIPHVAPPFWPETRAGRLAAAIYKNSAELLERPEALREAAGKCRVGLIGLADDTGVELNHGRPGAREGPHAFRRALAGYGVAIPIPSVGTPPGRTYPHVFDAGTSSPARTFTRRTIGSARRWRRSWTWGCFRWPSAGGTI